VNRKETHPDHSEKNAGRSERGLAGVTLVASLARFSSSMATFSEERAPSRPFGLWDLSVVVEVMRERCDVQVVGKSPRLIEGAADIARLVPEDVVAGLKGGRVGRVGEGLARAVKERRRLVAVLPDAPFEVLACWGVVTLGARGHLPCGYMVGLWWVLSKFAWQIPSG
jgi:hypothetical protein